MADKNQVNPEVEDMDEQDILTLEFDDDTAVDAEVIGIFDVDDKEYIALAPLDGTDDVYIYGYKDNDDDTFDLLEIDDDEEFNTAVSEFDKIMDVEE